MLKMFHHFLQCDQQFGTEEKHGLGTCGTMSPSRGYQQPSF